MAGLADLAYEYSGDDVSKAAALTRVRESNLGRAAGDLVDLGRRGGKRIRESNLGRGAGDLADLGRRGGKRVRRSDLGEDLALAGQGGKAMAGLAGGHVARNKGKYIAGGVGAGGAGSYLYANRDD